MKKPYELIMLCDMGDPEEVTRAVKGLRLELFSLSGWLREKHGVALAEESTPALDIAAINQLEASIEALRGELTRLRSIHRADALDFVCVHAAQEFNPHTRTIRPEARLARFDQERQDWRDLTLSGDLAEGLVAGRVYRVSLTVALVEASHD